MKLFNLSTSKAVLASGVFLFTAGTAMAGPSDEIALCETALSTHVAALQNDGGQTASFKFQERRGASVKKLYFKMSHAGYDGKVTCKVRRGTVIDILDNDGASIMTVSADKTTSDKNS